MRKIIFGALFIALTASFVLAQDQTTSTEYKKVEVFGGYSANNLTSGNPENFEDPNSNSTPTYRGWNASAVYNFNRFIGVKADVAGFYRKSSEINEPNTVPFRVSSSLYTFMAGIQLKDNKKTKRFSPFLQAMVGGARSETKIDLSQFNLPGLKETNTGFSMAIGGGLDIKVTKRFSIRAIQADYNPTFIGGNNQNNVRLGFGIVFH